ncbi:hypothetical protein AB9F35_36915, partial [Rhizobium leguminosarum]
DLLTEEFWLLPGGEVTALGSAIMSTRPETVGYGIADSPVGLAAWLYDKIADWVYTRGDPEQALGKEAILDNITLYW